MLWFNVNCNSERRVVFIFKDLHIHDFPPGKTYLCSTGRQTEEIEQENFPGVWQPGGPLSSLCVQTMPHLRKWCCLLSSLHTNWDSGLLKKIMNSSLCRLLRMQSCVLRIWATEKRNFWQPITFFHVPKNWRKMPINFKCVFVYGAENSDRVFQPGGRGT